MRAFLSLIFTLLCGPALLAAQSAQKLLVVLPFENASKAPGIEWIGEAFPAVLGERLVAPELEMIGREERLDAYERLAVPSHVRPSRATLFRIAQALRVGYAVVGGYDFDGNTFTARAQVLDVRRLELLPEVSASGPLVKLIDVQTALAWDLLEQLAPGLPISREQFVQSFPPVRLDAFENYVRGLLAGSRPDRLRFFRNAVRLSPDYALAHFALGRAEFEAREYQAALQSFHQVSPDGPVSREANFFLGLAAYFVGDFQRAEATFRFVASQMVLPEADNNLGVIASRRNQPGAVEQFRRAVQADPRDADFRFNLGVALYRTGDQQRAARHLREAQGLRPNDAEVRTLLAQIEANVPPGPDARIPLERIRTRYERSAFRLTASDARVLTERRMAKAEPRVHAEYHVQRGRSLLENGSDGEAGKEFREAIVLDPTNAGAHLGLALLLERWQDLAGARAEARTALRLSPSADTYLLLARLDLSDNSVETAAENVEQALRLEPDNESARQLRDQIAARRAGKDPQ